MSILMEANTKEVAKEQNIATPTVDETIPINFKNSESVPLEYANHSTVFVGEHEMIISFYQSAVAVERPYESEEMLSRLKETGINAECVARIVVSKSFYTALAELLQRNLPRYNKEQLKDLLTQLTNQPEENQ